MKGLLIKDFKLIKTQKLFIVIITAICGYLLAIGVCDDLFGDHIFHACSQYG